MINSIAAHRLVARQRLSVATRSILIPPTVTSWIANEFVPVESSCEGFDNLAPSRHSNEPLCRVQVQTAIFNSRRAADDWSQVSSWDRGAILRDMATIIRNHATELCELEALDTGIPLTQIETNHIDSAVSTLEYFASLIQPGLPGRILDTPHAGGHTDSFAYTRREPLGVCLGIGAWNYPLLGMMWKVAPALACGNSMIFKPSECTPLTALRVAELFTDVLPQSVLQVLPGSADVAQHLLASDGIDKVSVTGSLATGKRVAAQASQRLIRVTLELGGKSPLIVFADADMESVIRVISDGNFINNGQVCSNCTRVYVERSCLDDLIERLSAFLKNRLIMGDNMNRSTTMGPLMKHPSTPSQHFDRVTGFLDRARNDPRVHLLIGGARYQSSEGGYFVEPTVFLSKYDDTEIACEEVFGPVMTILPFDDESEAVKRANTSKFGLAAGVMTNDVMRAHRVAKKLQSGTVWINQWNRSPLEMPFGPYKQSGYGKELGTESLEQYSQVKTVYMEMGVVHDSIL
ncbi:aldehyde dehydrogenase [Fragilaria crotonensis]|nr:aldehyde dehydrogenase [Fragilaria crotonensis]